MLIPLGFFGSGTLAGYELISTQVLASSTPNVTFSSFSTTAYKHLQLRITTRSDNATTVLNVNIRLNSDTGSNYSIHNLYGDGTSAVSNGTATGSSWQIGLTSGASSTTSTFYTTVTDILDAFSTTKNKTQRSLSGAVDTSYKNIRMTSGAWNNSASAVSTILLYPDAGNFIAGSRFSLYGVRG